jgi:hypothetical protein
MTENNRQLAAARLEKLSRQRPKLAIMPGKGFCPANP